MKLHIYSWNVLHIIHELNYAINSSPVLDQYNISLSSTAGEKNRLKDIFNNIVKKLDKTSIFCLQEVPGDLFDKLTELKDYTVYNYKYKREPLIKNEKLVPYTNHFEYLVTIIHNDFKKFVNNTDVIQFEDPGKAAFIVNFNFNFKIINTHVPFSVKYRRNAFEQIDTYIKSNDQDKFAIIGDINCTKDELKKDLQDIKFANHNIPNIDGNTRKAKQNGTIFFNKIDHIITHNKLRVTRTAICVTGDVSDHYIIEATIIL